eukprot:scaffold9899_cov122-Isochrysis_galbana.AAC.7
MERTPADARAAPSASEPFSTNKTPRARGGQRWRPDSSCWSWRRSKWPRKRARNEFALTAQTKAQPGCDCHSERLPASLPSLATILLA